jgi:hypothetical protein
MLVMTTAAAVVTALIEAAVTERAAVTLVMTTAAAVTERAAVTLVMTTAVVMVTALIEAAVTERAAAVYRRGRWFISNISDIRTMWNITSLGYLNNDHP